jgi:hypothetical protein
MNGNTNMNQSTHQKFRKFFRGTTVWELTPARNRPGRSGMRKAGIITGGMLEMKSFRPNWKPEDIQGEPPNFQFTLPRITTVRC